MSEKEGFCPSFDFDVQDQQTLSTGLNQLCV